MSDLKFIDGVTFIGEGVGGWRHCVVCKPGLWRVSIGNYGMRDTRFLTSFDCVVDDFGNLIPVKQ